DRRNHGGRMASHRRRRRAGRGRILPHPRPGQGHVHLRGGERVSGRGRVGADGPPGGGGGGGGGHARPPLGRNRHRRGGDPVTGFRGGTDRMVPGKAGPLQGPAADPVHRRSPPLRNEQSAETRTDRLAGGQRVTSEPWIEEPAPPTSVDGAALSSRGERTRGALPQAAEEGFAEHGWEEASIVKITERAGVSQGTFYRYFVSKQAIFDELVDDLNRRGRRAMAEGAARGRSRTEAE